MGINLSCRRAPIGYQNKRDVQNKPIMIPSDKAPFIQYAFDAIEKGKNQSLIRQELLKKGYKISRNNMSLLLRNPIYIGKIILPAHQDEKETLIEAIHESIISERQFYNVQNILQNRRRKQKKPIYNSLREELPLRGKLHCSKCDSKMTGSPSRSSNGTQYFYYHCNHCKKERYNAHLVNNTFESILNDFVFTKNSKTESLQFDGKKCRTPRINDVLRYILQIDKDLPKNKTGQISSNLSLSRLVVPPGIEPGTHGFSVHCSTN